MTRRHAIDPATAHAAVRTVLARARDQQDARTLIGALGLTSALRAYESAPPPQVPAPAVDEPPAGPRPCDVCGLPVAAAYTARTGRTRHANHPEGA